MCMPSASRFSTWEMERFNEHSLPLTEVLISLEEPSEETLWYLFVRKTPAGPWAASSCLWASKEAAGSWAIVQAITTVRSVRRGSPKRTEPKVCSAHCSSDKKVLGFIYFALSLFFTLP